MIPAEAFHPGEFIREELEARGITNTEFAKVCGLGIDVVDAITSCRRPITADISDSFGAALSVSPSLFLALQRAYDNHMQQG